MEREGRSVLAADPEWWRGAVIYQIYPRSFRDTNGDGIVNLSDLNAVRNNFGAGASPVVPQGVALHISRLERAMRSLPSLRYSQFLRSAATDVLFSTLDEPLVPNPRRPAQRRLTGR